MVPETDVFVIGGGRHRGATKGIPSHSRGLRPAAH
jgi:hypothetical protein